MPVGFENSALKTSFSLSSLQPCGATPEQARLRAERPYNSLTKKSRKDREQELWRRSWGSRDENKDDFWAALQPNYNYLMDNNLIDSCKEASGELSWDEEDMATTCWSYSEFLEQYSELYSWLDSIQEAVSGRETLRLCHIDEMQKNAYRRKRFNDQAKKLSEQDPNVLDDISSRVTYINSRWDALEQVISPFKANADRPELGTDVERDIRYLRKWIHDMEGCLMPVEIRVSVGWSLQELQEKMQKHETLLKEVQKHGNRVDSVVSGCQLADKSKSPTVTLSRKASKLQERYYRVYLRAVEWVCHLENLCTRLRNPSPSGRCSYSDEEPVSKHPRLSSCGDLSDRLTDDGSYFEDDLEELYMMDTDSEPVNVNCVENNTSSSSMVGTGTPESLKKSMQRHSADATTLVDKALRNGSSHSDLNDNRLTSRGSTRRKSAPAGSNPCGASPRSFSHEDSSFNRSNRKARNCATFYFKHLDTDSEQDTAQNRMITSGNNLSEMKSVEESSEEEEWTYTHGNAQQNRKSDGGSGSSSETMSSVRGQQQKASVVMRLNFGQGPDNSNNVDEKMLVNNDSANQTENKTGEETSSPARKLSRNSKEAIQRLVNRAEEMVREEQMPENVAAVMRAARVFEPLVFTEGCVPSGNPMKYTRIKQWLKQHLHENAEGKQQTLDSCDASGEYTTGDSDEDRESESSEEQNGSVMTCRHLELMLGSAEAIPDPDATPVAERIPSIGSATLPQSASKVVMRTKRRQTVGERPWSVSGISQLGGSPSGGDGTPLAHFSISESALHQMITTPPSSKGRTVSSGNVGVQGNLSSSTIDEATLQAAEGSGSQTGSLRRRKVRLRKRNIGRKSESGSDGVTMGHSGSSDTQQQLSSSPHKGSHNKSRSSSGAEGSSPSARALVKSGSFSGTASVVRRVSERCTASDPAILSHHRRSGRFETTSGTGTETEEERRIVRQRMLPKFRLGPELGVVTLNVGSTKLEGDSDIEKNSGQATEEQLSSFSEQAWDNYQEKYMSEPYSEELADSEAARRLLEFGDDYRNFLDSQSDCASSLSAKQIVSPVRKRKPVGGAAGDRSVLDSDSDLEDIHHLIRKSHSQYVFSEQELSKQLSKASTELVLAAEFAEIAATCKENINCLRLILEGEGGLLSSQECKDIRGLLKKWEALFASAEDMHKVRELQREMSQLRDELLELSSRVTTIGSDLNNRDQLEERIQRLKAELTALVNRKKQLLYVNLEVHHFQSDTGVLATPLKDDVAGLYLIWDETFQSVTAKISSLERASQTWQAFEARLSELQVALRGDHNTLRMLSSALQGGAVSPDVATSVRDVAKVLSEKQESDHDNYVGQSTTVLANGSPGSIAPVSTEGSLSDSGISDSGSEQELCERERRLEALRRLARHLEAELEPGSVALLNMDKRIEQLELELRNLQKTCRDLIVRTAVVCVEARPALPTRKQPSSPVRASAPGPRIHAVSSSRRNKLRKALAAGSPDDPDDPEPGKHRPWLWRVMRAALPFQMALVALFCVACLLEPHCCDAINSLSLSFTPQLRYVRGPPPV